MAVRYSFIQKNVLVLLVLVCEIWTLATYHHVQAVSYHKMINVAFSVINDFQYSSVYIVHFTTFFGRGLLQGVYLSRCLRRYLG